MSFCERCGTQLEGEAFCKQCGAEQKNPESFVVRSATTTPSERKKSRIGLIVGFIAIVVIAGLYYSLGKEKEELNETEAIDEKANLKGEKEVKDHGVVDQEKEGKETRPLLYQDTNLLDSLINGSLNEIFHIGRTRDELIDQAGPAIVEYFREGESRLDYADVTYMLSPNNERIYSVMLLLNAEETANFHDIRDTLGNSTEAILADSGQEDANTYFLSYGTEDSMITFYSDSEQGQPIYKVIYSNLSIYSAKSLGVRKEKPGHPGEIEPLVLQIRKEYHAVNDQISAMKKVALEKGKTAYLNGQGVVRKVIEKTTEGTVEYYFNEDQEVFFIFQYKGAVEHRFYFADDQLIRWIPPNKVTIDYDTGQHNNEYKEWETTWLESVEE